MDSSSLVRLWEQATMKNIDYQFKTDEYAKDKPFYQKVLLSGREFVASQSKKGGLRADFAGKIVGLSNFLPILFKDVYIVEYYHSGEAFKGKVNMYCLGAKAKTYKYVLESGSWELASSDEIADSSIASLFSDTREYLCNEYYAEDSIIITHISQQVAVSKALFFPCSKDFRRIKKVFSL
jgi:hypothetical protein